jgi:GT2 family glycosyltransferase
LTNQCDFVACSIDLLKLNPPWLGGMRYHAQTIGLQKIWYPPYLFHAGGGTLGVRRMVHDAIGGFDESLAVLEDTDYCFRIQLAGFQLQFVKDAVMHVRIRDSWSALFNQSRMWAEYNVRVYRKYRKYSGTFVRQQWRRYVSGWIDMIRQLPNLRQRRAWAPFIWTLGWQIGLLQGSIKYRVEPVPFS